MEINYIDQISSGGDKSIVDTLDNSNKIIKKLDSLNNSGCIPPLISIIIDNYLPNHKELIYKQQRDKLFKEPIKFIKSLSTSIQWYSESEIASTLSNLVCVNVETNIELVKILISLSKSNPDKIKTPTIEKVIQSFENRILVFDVKKHDDYDCSYSNEPEPFSLNWVNEDNLNSWELLNEYSSTFIDALGDQLLIKVNKFEFTSDNDDDNDKLEYILYLLSKIPIAFRQQIHIITNKYFKYIYKKCCSDQDTVESLLSNWSNILKLSHKVSIYLQKQLADTLLIQNDKILGFNFFDQFKLNQDRNPKFGMANSNFHLEAFIYCWRTTVKREIIKMNEIKLKDNQIFKTTNYKQWLKGMSNLYLISLLSNRFEELEENLVSHTKLYHDELITQQKK